MNKKPITLVLSLVLILSCSSSTLATPTKDSLNKQKQQIETQKNTINQNIQKNTISFDDAQKDISNLTLQIQDLDFKIEGLNGNINDANAKINSKLLEIKTQEAKLAKNSADLVAEQELFNARIRNIYISGPNQSLAILFASKSIDDLYANIDAVKAISKLDKQIIDDLNTTTKNIKDAKAALETQNAQLIAARSDLQDKLSQLKNSKSQQQTLITQAKSKQAYYASQISGFKAKLDEANKQAKDTENQLKAIALQEAQAQLAAQKAAAASKSGSKTALAPPATTNAIVAYAYKFMGTTYVWGGTSPNPGFDCSGYMQYVYAHFGVNISRTTYTQISEGKAVSRDQLQAGDLIFFGTYSDPHHVGMYIGNNCFIHAPSTGDVIKISSLNDTDYLCARRILK